VEGYLYILECFNGQYYTGSTINLAQRFVLHQNGEGPNFTWKHLPVKLIYVEIFDNIELAFNREKQIQGWSKKKKEALMSGNLKVLHRLSECKNESHSDNWGHE